MTAAEYENIKKNCDKITVSYKVLISFSRAEVGGGQRGGRGDGWSSLLSNTAFLDWSRLRPEVGKKKATNPVRFVDVPEKGTGPEKRNSKVTPSKKTWEHRESNPGIISG